MGADERGVMGLMGAVISIDAQGSRRVLVAHDEMADVMRRLHDDGVALVLCEATGPGWIVSYRGPDERCPHAPKGPAQ